jgi:hypothetical protein
MRSICIFFCLFSLQLYAQKILNIPDIVLATQQGEVLAKRKLELTGQINSYKFQKNVFETKCKGVEVNTSLDAVCKTEQKEIENIRDRLIEAVNKLNDDIKSESDRLSALNEQKNLTENFDVWISDQHTRVQEAVNADSNWTNQFKDYLKGFAPPDLKFQPKGLNDLKNGDVLLLFPITTKDKLTDWGDKFYNSYSHDEDLKACHALVFVGRDPGGRALFLNNTAKSYLHSKDSPGGPHIISQSEFEKEYGQYDYHVARPRDVVDGKELFLAAQEMHIQASKNISLFGSSYGVLGNDLVCSGTSDMVVARATGRQNIDKGKFIDVSPNNFFDKQDVGRYYIISPIVKQK